MWSEFENWKGLVTTFKELAQLDTAIVSILAPALADSQKQVCPAFTENEMIAGVVADFHDHVSWWSPLSLSEFRL